MQPLFVHGCNSNVAWITGGMRFRGFCLLNNQRCLLQLPRVFAVRAFVCVQLFDHSRARSASMRTLWDYATPSTADSWVCMLDLPA